MKKIVVVSGSPRKSGNTMSMVKIVEDEMKQLNGLVEFEYIYLIEKNLRYCIGCCKCLREGGDRCPLKDDKDEILEKMLKADGLIFASPGYAAMVSGLFKNFIDRFMYQDHIPEFVGKPTLIVSTSGGDGVMGAPKYMANMSFYWWGCTIVDVIGIGHAFYSMNDKVRAKTLKRLKDAAGKLNTEIVENPIHAPNFRQYMYFLFNKTELEVSPDVMPYRTSVWIENGWMDRPYYYETFVNPLFRMIGFALSSIMKLVYRNLLGKDASQKLAHYVENN